MQALRRRRRHQGLWPHGARARTTSAPRAATSWTRSNGASSGCGSTTSISIRSTARHWSRRSRRRCARSTISCARAWCATSAAPTGPAWRMAKAHAHGRARGWTRFETLQAYYSHRRPRHRARDRAHAGRPEDRPDGVESAGRRAPVRQVRSRQQRPAEGARRATFDFPPVDKERAWASSTRCARSAAPKGARVARVALAWMLSRPFVTSVIIGAKTLEQLDDNLAAVGTEAHGRRNPTARRRSARSPPEYPGWMIPRQNNGRRPPN